MNLKFYGRGLEYDQTYNFYSLPLKHSIKTFGDLINARSPIHIKDDGLLQNVVDRFYSIDGEVENYTLNGGLICRAGVCLKEAFVGLGYNENTRLFRDYDSRLYFMEKVSN
jgi:alpha-galactosidase